MPKRTYEFISSLPLITTILLAGIAPVLAQTADVKIADSKPTSQPTSSSNDRDNQACITTKVQEYVSKLGTPDLTNTDFEALVKCGAQAVPVLSQALKNDRAEVRASAAYALGQIGQAAYVAVPNLVMILRDDSSTDVRALAAWSIGRIGSKAQETAVPELITIFKGSAVPGLITIFKKADEDSVVHDQTVKALNEIGTKEAIAALNESRNVPSLAETSTTLRKSQCFSRLASIFGCMKFEMPELDISFEHIHKVQNRVQIRTLSALPIICSLPGIRNILPRCK